MASNKGKNTKPELLLRSSLHALGYRFQVHGKGLPGTPDIVFTRKRKVLWLHGCFWHAHPGCRFAATPRTRAAYWLPKLARNQERDRQHVEAVNEMGWQSLVIWECELTNIEAVRTGAIAFLGQTRTRKGLAITEEKSGLWRPVATRQSRRRDEPRSP
jgi:DNA mismatch endonuclease (patch repair protein)